MISANKLYKESKSQLSFKDWLKETQQKGILQDHEKMYNMIESEGEDEEEDDEDDDLPTTSKKTSKSTTQTAKTKLGMVNLLGFVGLAVLIYGLSRTSAE